MSFTLKSITPLLMALVAMSSCQSNKEALIGVWRLDSVLENNQSIVVCAPGEEPYYAKFYESGALSNSYGAENVSYRVVDDSLYISAGEIEKNWHFLVEGDVLTLSGTSSDGKTMVQTYSRQVDNKFE